MSWLAQLGTKKDQRGSRPRCVLMMEGDRDVVARRLTDLIGLSDVQVLAEDRWMPTGKPVQRPDGGWDDTPAAEAKLGNADTLLPAYIREELQRWWLAVAKNANTPNWDIASTCVIGNAPGLLLVEAKAHANECGTGGKRLPTSPNGWRNHMQIGRAIADVAAELQRSTVQPWRLSRDSHYQLSNRFAWSWMSASLGVPVVLMYLGFLKANEVNDLGPIFESADEWQESLSEHSRNIVDPASWERRLEVGDIPLLPIVRSYEQPFDAARELPACRSPS